MREIFEGEIEGNIWGENLSWKLREELRRTIKGKLWEKIEGKFSGKNWGENLSDKFQEKIEEKSWGESLHLNLREKLQRNLREKFLRGNFRWNQVIQGRDKVRKKNNVNNSSTEKMINKIFFGEVNLKNFRLRR